MTNSRVTDLRPLRGMPLIHLETANSPIGSLEPLAGMALVELRLDNSDITDLSPCAGMPLRILNCSDNRIRDLSPLRGMELQELGAAGNRISDLSPLRGAPLRCLSVTGNPLNSLGPFEQNPPARITFDTVTAGSAYVASVLSRWEAQGDTASARQSRTAIAYRHGDQEALLALTSSFEGNRYLHVRVAMTFTEAREVAARFGGHLVTITSESEFRHAYSLLPPTVGAWLGIDYTRQPLAWVTGEPLTFTNFNSRAERSEHRPMYMLNRYNADGSWYRAAAEDMETDVIIEWE